MKEENQYKYIVVEDENLIRKNIIKKIESLHLPFLLVGESNNGIDAMKLADEFYPDLVLTDICMPQCDGIKLAEYLHKNYPNSQIIILSGYDDFSYAQSAIRFGVKDYLLKPIDISKLSETLQKILITLRANQEKNEQYQNNLHDLDQQAICELMEKYIRENYQDEISFQELGEKFGFTPEYLGKIFKKYTGETPLKYLTKIRMNQAKHLLISQPDMEIKNIGKAVGYQDGFYFSRAFKSYTGMQPSEYRNSK